MKFISTRIPGLVIIEPTVFGDERGFFMETFHSTKFKDAGITAHFVQDNHSKSSRGILRGLHYQIKHAQGKLVRVVAGEVFDVAVDLRHDSPTCGQWVGEVLSAENRRMLWVPPGFAHGFFVTSDSAEFVYKCTELYSPQHERTIQWDDPQLGIKWPVEPGTRPIVSAKDAAGVPFNQAELF